MKENQKQHFRKNTAFNPSSGWKEVEKAKSKEIITEADISK